MTITFLPLVAVENSASEILSESVLSKPWIRSEPSPSSYSIKAFVLPAILMVSLPSPPLTVVPVPFFMVIKSLPSAPSISKK